MARYSSSNSCYYKVAVVVIVVVVVDNCQIAMFTRNIFFVISRTV